MTRSTPTLKTDSDGNRRWHIKGKLHRADGPAIEYANGSKIWYVNGERHRVDGPAVEYANGQKEWWLNWERHRTDGPAIEYPDGGKSWWVNGNEILAPYVHLLTAVFNRGLSIPQGAVLEMVATPNSQTASEQIEGLKIVLYKYWPMHVQKVLATLFMDTDPAIKHLAFSLIGREALQKSILSTGIL